MISISIREIYRVIHNEWLGKGVFLGRGNFTELMVSIAEVLTGIHMLIVGEAGVGSSFLLHRFDSVIAVRILGIIWLTSGILTLIGISLYIIGIRTSNGYKTERLFRFLGSLGSFYIWLSAAIALSPSAFCYIYYGIWIASMRTTRIVWRN